MNSIAMAKSMRINAVKMVSSGGSSHIGSALSCIDIAAVLYANIMKYDVKDPRAIDRDRFILSKGHAGVCVYTVLAEAGFFPKDELAQHYQNGSCFSGHVSHKNIPGVELSTGSLGHGLPVGVGMALSAKLDARSNRVFVLIGDGELLEGSNWEAIFFAAHHKLDNLTLIIDRNNLQSIYSTEKTIALESISNKFEAFNWKTNTVDGHSHQQLKAALAAKVESQPSLIIANTIKGKGVSFMENRVEWHYKFPNPEQLEIALQELEASV
jgi:transketolase